MPRPPRIEYEGALYHVTSRGNGRQVIFHADADRERFLEQLQDNLETFAVDLYAYVLMSNHYHLLVRTRRANLGRFVQRLNTSYGLYYRYRHRKPGHVFQGRYKAKVVGSDEYLLGLTRYIHLNPVKTREASGWSRAKRITWLEAYRWSSYPGYVSERAAQPWVNYAVLKAYGRSRGVAGDRYRAYTQANVLESDEALRALLSESAHAVGDERFRAELEAQLRKRRRGDERDRDVNLPDRRVELGALDRVVAEAYGVEVEHLKAHGHRAGEAKVMAVELAVRLSGLNQREIGRHYGGIGSSAVAMIRRKARRAGAPFERRLAALQERCVGAMPIVNI